MFVTKLLLLGLLLGASPLSAHHSIAAEYDSSKPVEIAGTVTKLDWTNPHVWLQVEVKGKNGQTTIWNFELGSPNLLLMNGWRKNSVRVGDRVVVDGLAAKDAEYYAKARSVKTADGKVLNAVTPVQ